MSSQSTGWASPAARVAHALTRVSTKEEASVGGCVTRGVRSRPRLSRAAVESECGRPRYTHAYRCKVGCKVGEAGCCELVRHQPGHLRRQMSRLKGARASGPRYKYTHTSRWVSARLRRWNSVCPYDARPRQLATTTSPPSPPAQLRVWALRAVHEVVDECCARLCEVTVTCRREIPMRFRTRPGFDHLPGAGVDWVMRSLCRWGLDQGYTRNNTQLRPLVEVGRDGIRTVAARQRSERRPTGCCVRRAVTRVGRVQREVEASIWQDMVLQRRNEEF